MEIIIEFDKKSSFPEYSQIERPDYILIGIEKEKYFLIYDGTDYQIIEKEVNELLGNLRSVNLDKLPKYGMGCDGDTYTLKLSNGWNSVQFKWWSDSCGEQWDGLFCFKENLITLKNDCLRRSRNLRELEKEFFLTVYGEEELEKLDKLMEKDENKKQQNLDEEDKKSRGDIQ